ncbi:MAG: 3-phosphoshikimate 1-carboxyvinyltransferase, partial [Candidatus Dadabacteria bacterium]|nr:3-phosphoshikimate 1-carboxyvinyltransferase [Candidatus Dadabacteria bacterium]
NPLRTGVVDILKDMGGDISLLDEREVSGEPVADLLVKSSALNGVTIGGALIPRAIDELPVIAAAAAYAEGTTVIKDAAELRVKETDRIKAIASELGKMGADVEEFDDGMAITGKERLTGAECESWGDHRIAMAVAVAASRAEGETGIDDAGAVAVSFPEFFLVLKGLRS